MPRCGDHCPSARCSMAAKFGTCRMIHLGLWICGRVLRTGPSPSGRVDSLWTTSVLPTGCPPSRALAHKLHRLNNKITERMMH